MRCCATIRSRRICASCWKRSGRRCGSISSRARRTACRSRRDKRARGLPARQDGARQAAVRHPGGRLCARAIEWMHHSMAPTADRRRAVPHHHRRPGLRPALFGVGLQYLGDELRRAQPQRDPRAERAAPRRAASRTTPARAASAPITARTAATSSGRSAPAISAAATATARSIPDEFAASAANDQIKMVETQAQPGRQARPWRRAAGGQGLARRSPRSAACRWAGTASRRPATRRSRRRSR